ncbi:alpha/beta hydrolase-fold protein [Lacibacter sp. H407]|uniref:alpha/beta hydrolase-fold protein n=1 Tax=Lacibacter sp. H407 TaxID=3133423 RepID=UPI0030BFFF5F
MIKTILLFCCFFFTTFTFGQTESDYYQAPKDMTFSSKILGEKRNVSIILPKSFHKEKATKFPLIVVFDRQNKRIFRQTFEEINYLVSFDEMPEAVIIGISTENNQKRLWETSLKSSMENATGENFIRFLYEELIPWAEADFNCGSNRIFIGHSRFGYFSSYLLTNKLTDLTGVISLSPFFKEPNVNLIDTLKKRLSTTTLNHKVYYRFITGDSITDTNDYSLMKSFLSKAKPIKNFNWKGTAFYNAKHNVIPGLGVMPSLLEVFDYWSDEMTKVHQSEQPFTTEVYTNFTNQMKIHYGDGIGLGLAILNGIGYKFYNTQKYEHARAAWQILLQEYPMFTYAYISIAKSHSKEGNKIAAVEFYSKAKQQLTDNSFYSEEQRVELMTEIEAEIKALQN